MHKSESMTNNPVPRDLHTIPLSLLFCYAKMFWKSKEIITSQNSIFLFPSNNTHLLLNQSQLFLFCYIDIFKKQQQFHVLAKTSQLIHYAKSFFLKKIILSCVFCCWR